MKFPSSQTAFIPNFINNNVNESIHNFENTFYQSYDQCCPIQTKQVSQNTLNKPGVTLDIVHLIKRKHIFFKRYKQSIVPFHIYNEHKNYFTRRLKQCKKQYFRDKFDSCANNTKASCKCINSLIGSKNTKSKCLNITLPNDVVSSDSPLVAECLNNYFVNVVPSLDANIPVNQMSHINFMGQIITNSLYAMPSTPNMKSYL